MRSRWLVQIKHKGCRRDITLSLFGRSIWGLPREIPDPEVAGPPRKYMLPRGPGVIRTESVQSRISISGRGFEQP